MALRTDYTNETDSTDTHPAAHNDTNLVVNQQQTDLDAAETAITANASAIAALNSRLTALETSAARRANIGPAGYWVWAWDFAAHSNVAVTAQRSIFIRFIAGQAFDGLQWDVPTAVAASTLIGGVYATDTNGLPTALVAQQSMDTSTTGNKTFTFTAQPAGIYWVATLPSHAINMRCSSSANPIFVSPSATSPTLAGTWNGWWFNSQVSLPNPFAGTPLLASGMIPVPLLRLA